MQLIALLPTAKPAASKRKIVKYARTNSNESKLVQAKIHRKPTNLNQ